MPHITQSRNLLSNPVEEYMYETRGGATFKKGTCGGTRISSTSDVILMMPSYGPAIRDVSIVAG